MEPNWLNRDLYPFASRFVEIDGYRIHYIDEGEGTPILFSHGTPEWSFGWRDLVRGLRGQYRCIALDHLGFGLSDKPADADYSVRAHAARLEKFIEKLQLPDFHIVANDFGLSISLAYAVNHPERAQRISIFNGWMWPLGSDSHYAKPAKIMRGWLGRILYKYFNFPVNIVMPAAFGNKRNLTKEVHRHYKMALPNAASRTAAYAFAHELLDAAPFWADLWQRRERISGKPFLVFWGMKDTFVPTYELEKWEKALTNARIVRLKNAGHFAQEEEPEQMLTELKLFFK
ncbi:MAG: alpha/beta fold hydrolase [Saprospiraceae bacterium]|nr:alpha/beta fold hydrolase [Saprospiraceae bacterium]